MVDVSDKAVTLREATAGGLVVMEPATLALIMEGKAPKGDVLAAARIAGIMAAKRTHELVPLCHPLTISKIDGRAQPRAGEKRHCGDRHRCRRGQDRRRDGGADRRGGGLPDAL